MRLDLEDQKALVSRLQDSLDGFKRADPELAALIADVLGWPPGAALDFLGKVDPLVTEMIFNLARLSLLEADVRGRDLIRSN